MQSFFESRPSRSQFTILDRRAATRGVRHNMMEFEEASFRTAAVRADDGALSAIASQTDVPS
jgi:hypothetical protein